MSEKKFKEEDIKKHERVRKIIQQALSDAMTDIEAKTGYYTQIEYYILQDDIRKSIDVEVDIALIERPHAYNEQKVKHYLKYNPDDCLNKPVILYEYDTWYKLYDGVHRTEANRRLGKEKIKAKIVIPTKEHKEIYKDTI